MLTRASREFVRPLPMTAVGLLAVNDHVLKGARVLPGWCTGKLSDLAGMFFFPILLFALAEQIRPTRRRLRRATILASLTAAVFVALKTMPAVHALVEGLGWGTITFDPTDTLAVPCAALAVWFLRTPPVRTPRLGRVGVVFAALASLATSRPYVGHAYWSVSSSPVREHEPPPLQEVGCARVQAAIVRSGKEGIGVLLADRSEPACAVRVAAAFVRVGDLRVTADTLTGWDERRSMYLAFPFDNQSAWNRGVRRGRIELHLEGAATGVMVFPMVHSYGGPHSRPIMDEWPSLSDGGAPPSEDDVPKVWKGTDGGGGEDSDGGA